MAGATVGIKFEGKKIRIGGTGGGPMSFTTAQMLQLGSFANKAVIARTRSGIGSDDARFPSLKTGRSAVRINGRFVRQRQSWPERKAAHGLRPIRDLYGLGDQGGHMLDNSSVRYADDNTVKIAFTSRAGRMKALANEKRTPFYAFSDSDAKKIIEYAGTLFRSTARRVFEVFAGRRAA